MRSFVVASGFRQSIAVVVVVVVDVEQVLNAGNTGTSGAPGLQIEARLLLLLLLADRLCCCGDENSAVVVLYLLSFLPLPCLLSNKQTSIDKSPAHTPNQTRKINRENNNLNKQRASLTKKKRKDSFASLPAEDRHSTSQLLLSLHETRERDEFVCTKLERSRFLCLHNTRERDFCVCSHVTRERDFCVCLHETCERDFCVCLHKICERDFGVCTRLPKSRFPCVA